MWGSWNRMNFDKWETHMGESYQPIACFSLSPSTKGSSKRGNGFVQKLWRCPSFVTEQPAIFSCEAVASSVIHRFIWIFPFSVTHFLFLSHLLFWDKTPKALKLCLVIWFPGNLDFDTHEVSTSPKFKQMSKPVNRLWNHFQCIAISIWKHNEIE